MMTYLLRRIDPALWRRVKAKAALEGTSINTLILKLLTKWVGHACLALMLVGCGNAGPMAPSSAAPSAAGLNIPPELAAVFAELDADPWIHPLIGEPMSVYVRRYIRRIELDSTIAPNIAARSYQESGTIQWNAHELPNGWNTPNLAAYLLHEVRHLQGFAHTCPGANGAPRGDRTFEEGGAFAVHILYLEHMHLEFLADEFRRDYIGCH